MSEAELEAEREENKAVEKLERELSALLTALKQAQAKTAALESEHARRVIGTFRSKARRMSLSQCD